MRRPPRRLLAVLAALAALLAGIAGAAYYRVVVVGNRDVHHGAEVPFQTRSVPLPTQTQTQTTPRRPGAKRRPSIAWAVWGFDPQHTRYNPEAHTRPPFRTVWKRGLGDLVEFPPSVDDRGIFVETNNGRVVSISPASGRSRWVRQIDRPLASTPALSRTRLYVAALGSRERGGHVYALRRSDGHVAWAFRPRARTESSPVLVNGTLYFGSEDGTLYALWAATGRVRWRAHAGGALKASPAYSGGRLYIGAYDGQLYCFDARSGRLIWRKSGLGRYGGLAGGQFYATPTVAYGRVYVGSTDRRVYSFGAGDGSLAWSHSTGGFVYSATAVFGGRVFVGSYDGVFYALDGRTGDVRWSVPVGRPISGAATVVDGIVYFSAFDRGTFGLDVRNGRLRFRSRGGRYSPVVATRDAFYLVGYGSLARLAPRGSKLPVAPPRHRVQHRRPTVPHRPAGPAVRVERPLPRRPPPKANPKRHVRAGHLRARRRRSG